MLVKRQTTRPRNLIIESATQERLTHQLFRFPAKFHPPVARALLAEYTLPGQRIMDPFCGSGTLLVEAKVMGRHSVGSDVDPVAVFVTKVKTAPIPASRLRASFERLTTALRKVSRGRNYEELQWTDIGEGNYERAIRDVSVPAIPNLLHWFRRYVVVDLGRLFLAIAETPMPASHRRFFRLCAAAVIRNASNADPVPVSGLEVTSHMKRRDTEGRVVDPFHLFARKADRAIRDMETFVHAQDSGSAARAFQADATSVAGKVRGNVDAVITSPPYHGAVDYYRRHQLEMFWLGLTTSHDDRLKLLPKYIGRHKVPQSHPLLLEEVTLNSEWEQMEQDMREVSRERADAFRHYCAGMNRSVSQLAKLLPAGAPAVLVLGHSSWNGLALDTSSLFRALAGDAFELDDYLSYPVRNRYMSYSRRNGASIDREYVLVLRRAV